MAAAAARDGADQHSPRQQPMPAWTYFGWLDHRLTASADQLAHGRHGINVSSRIKQMGSGAVRVGLVGADVVPVVDLLRASGQGDFGGVSLL